MDYKAVSRNLYEVNECLNDLQNYIKKIKEVICLHERTVECF